MHHRPRPAGRRLHHLQGRRPVAAQTPSALDDPGEPGHLLKTVQMGDDNAVRQRNVGDPRQLGAGVGLDEEAPHARTGPDDGGVDPVVHRIRHDARHGPPVLHQRQRNRPVPVDGDVIEGPVDRVEHPHATGPAAGRMPLLPDQRVACGGQAPRHERLDGAVDLSDDVVAVALGLDPQGLPGIEGEAGPGPDRPQGEGEKLRQVAAVVHHLLS